MSYYSNYFLVLVLLFFVTACATNKPVLPLTVSKCVNADILMVPEVIVSGKEREWAVRIRVNVKCRNRILPSAMVKLKYPWLAEFTVMSNQQGNAIAKRVTSKQKKPDGTIVMWIKTSDGILSQAVSF